MHAARTKTDARMTLCALALLAGVGSSAGGQGQPTTAQPLDVNAIRPGQPGSERLVGVAASGRPGAAPVEEGETYRVGRFLIEYRTEHPQQPSAEEILNTPVRLGVVPGGFVSTAGSDQTTTMRLADVNAGNAATFTGGALAAVARGIVESLQARGLASVVVQPHPDDLNLETGEDLRPTRDGDMRLVVWMGVVGPVRTIAAGERFEKKIGRGEMERVNSAAGLHRRIREQSPVQPGELVRKDAIDDFVYRLNRHPGRRVDVGVSPGEEEGTVALDYIVNETKPWTIYGQISNTGTDETNRLRERIGFVHNQLTGSDDILRLDYITGGLDESNAFLASYDFPLRSDEIRMRVYGSFSEYDASEVGFADEAFSGQNYGVGAEVAWNVLQRRQLFLDAVGGLRWQSVKSTNDLFLETGKEQYAVPYIGLRAERVTDVSQTYAALTFEVQEGDLSGVNFSDLNRLGRTPVDEDWQTLKWDFSHGFYLEPLIGNAYEGGERGPTTLAHEIAVALRGQYAFNNRLIPSEQEIAGGMFSVRGYPESVAAGDTVVIASAEYRYHIPRAWRISPPGTINGRRQDWVKPWMHMDNFRFAPSEEFGRTDWDLIAKGFVDVGVTDVSFPQPGEQEQTLVGVGVGAEFHFKRYLTARLDWGFAVNDVEQPTERVDAGDNELHFMLTILY